MAYRNYATANGFIVAKDGNGDFSTITAALTAATSGTTIYIRDGVYTENLTLKAGVNLVAMIADAYTPNVTIVGKCSASFSGTCSLSGLRLKTNSDYCLEVTGSNATIVYFENCFIQAANNTALNMTVSNTSSLVYIENCKGNLDTTGIAYFNYTGTGGLRIFNSSLRNSANSSTASKISSGTHQMDYSLFENTITFDTLGSGSLTCYYCTLDSRNNLTCVTNMNFLVIAHCNLSSGTAAAVTVSAGTAYLHGNTINSSNTNISSGAGTTVYSLNYASGGTSPGTYGTTNKSETIIRAAAINATSYVNSYFNTSQTLPASSTLSLNTIGTNTQWLYTAASTSDSTYRAVAMVWAFTGTTVVISNLASNNMTFTNSGLTIQLSNSTGSSKTVDIAATRMR